MGKGELHVQKLSLRTSPTSSLICPLAIVPKGIAYGRSSLCARKSGKLHVDAYRAASQPPPSFAAELRRPTYPSKILAFDKESATVMIVIPKRYQSPSPPSLDADAPY